MVHVDGNQVNVYFKDKEGATPEARTAAFRMPSDHLEHTGFRSDPSLDDLPPWTGSGFERSKTELHFPLAKKQFSQHFGAGFDDSEYVRRERAGKEAASKRYAEDFAPFVPVWIASGNVPAVIAALRAVYRGDRATGDEPLELLYAPVEEPAYFDALERDADATISYVSAALQFLAADTQANFDRFVTTLLALPTRAGGAHLDHWTTLSWLPFIASPQSHVFVKPTIMRTFASLLPFDLRYRSELNYETYRRSVRMATQLRNMLQVSDLNVSRRQLDMIDVQSFMWVVIRYSQPGLAALLE